jgi:hypothetical protein
MYPKPRYQEHGHHYRSIDVGHVAGSYEVGRIPARSVIRQASLEVSEEFDGTLDLGKSGSASVYVADASFIKTVTPTPDPIMIGAFLDEEVSVILTVGSGTTGAGKLVLAYEVVP